MIRSSLRRWASGIRRTGLVLLYHRVASLKRDPQLLAVRPETFDEQLRVLRRRAVVLPLGELLDAAVRGRLPRRAVSITFDDGYADNLTHAKPVLARHAATATVFAVSGAVRKQTEFWWDTLERALLGTEGRANLELALSGGVACWQLDGRPDDHPTWNVLSADDPTPRHKAYRELMPRVKALAPDARRAMLSQLLQAMHLSTAPDDASRPLTEAELRELAADGRVEIGAHCVSHPQLSSLDAAEQLAEMASSKAELESLVRRPIRSFAYPYGTRADYTAQSAQLAAQAGFDLACANFPGAVRKGVDRLQVPRVIVRELKAAPFEAHLEQAFRSDE